ncbi:MAG: hypothetical protein AB8B82_15850 [Roseovarius sp.]
MPFIIAALGIALTVYFFVVRARNAGHMAGELVDMASDVKAAARRFGFKRRTNVHPVDTIEDPRLAIGAIATAFLEMDDLPTKNQRDALHRSLRQQFDLDAEAAQEITVLGHWFVSECGGAQPAIDRLSRKLVKLQGRDAFEPLLHVVNAMLSAGSDGLNDTQRQALDDVKRNFRIT